MKPGRTKGPFGLAPATVARPSIADIACPANSTLPVTHPLGVRMEPSGDAAEFAVIRFAPLFYRRSYASHLDCAPSADALVGRKNNPKAVDGVAHMIGEI